MLAIRLYRQGKKNQPFFKIVVTEKQKSSTRGRFVEEIGFYNPLTKERKIVGERVKYWISVGAQPSDTVHNMLVSEKIIDSPKIPKHKKAKKKEEEASNDSVPQAGATPEKETSDSESKPAAAETESSEAAKEEKPAEEESKEEVSQEEQKTETPSEEKIEEKKEEGEQQEASEEKPKEAEIQESKEKEEKEEIKQEAPETEEKK